MPADGPGQWTRHPLTAVLESLTEGCCPGRVNLHCHTLCSDGSLSPVALASQAADLGLEHLAITDHHSDRAFAEAQSVLQARRAAGDVVPTLWRGTEISCLLSTCLVHVLGLGFEADHPAMAPYLQGEAPRGAGLHAGAVAEAIHQAGGLAVLAHPARYRLPFAVLLQAATALHFDAAETWYDYEMGASWRPTGPTCRSIDLARRGLGLLATAGTDTHGFVLTGR
ncbi:MAG: PHP domain-containing protein [Aphanocapsa feldmannii 288cV]|nr:MAG: PHP domain-containing protein [Aphanocapsa feldmannii 288cV]